MIEFFQYLKKLEQKYPKNFWFFTCLLSFFLFGQPLENSYQFNGNVSSSIGKQILLEKLFPDWSERVEFEQKQQKFFESGQKKLIYAKRARIQIKLTDEEQDAYHYFYGTGFDKLYQSPETSPNKFDTRASFLKKNE